MVNCDLGSKRAIAIAKKSIPAALNKLNESIARVNTLDSNAITSFAEQTTKIFEIVGPEAAKFVEKKAALDESIRKKRIDQQNLITNLGTKKGINFGLQFFMFQWLQKNRNFRTRINISKLV